MVTISDREDVASCGRRTGLFYLAKDARRGEPQFKGNGVGKTPEFVGPVR